MDEVTEDRIDRRQRKSRRALFDALLNLVAERPYDSITIDDIVTEADVARATFYAHYRDKAHLLESMTQRLMDDLMVTVADVSWSQPPTFSGDGVKVILGHVNSHRDLYRVLISGDGGPGPRAALIATFRAAAAGVFDTGASAQDRKPRTTMALITTTFVGALFLTIERWLAGELRGNADAISVEFMQIATGGLGWALGFEPGEIHYRAADPA